MLLYSPLFRPKLRGELMKKILAGGLFLVAILLTSCMFLMPEGEVIETEDPTSVPERECDSSTAILTFEGNTRQIPDTSDKYIDIPLQNTLLVDHEDPYSHFHLDSGTIESDSALDFAKQLRVYSSGILVAWATRSDQISCKAGKPGCFSSEDTTLQLAVNGEENLRDMINEDSEIIFNIELLAKSPSVDTTLSAELMFKFFNCP